MKPPKAAKIVIPQTYRFFSMIYIPEHIVYVDDLCAYRVYGGMREMLAAPAHLEGTYDVTLDTLTIMDK